MTSRQIAPSGGTIDVCWHHGRICVAWQGGPGPDARMVYQEIDAAQPTLPVLLSLSWHLGSDVGAFPRLLSALGHVWLIYREGKSLGGRAVLRRDGAEVWRSPAECGGNDPVCLGVSLCAWQQAGDNLVRLARLTEPDSQWAARRGAPTGLSHIDADQRVVLVDEARGVQPGMTRPSWAGTLVAGEHPDSGALVVAADGRALRLWPGEDAYVPRLAHDGTGAYAVVTHGRQGIRLAVFADADLVAPAPAPVPVWDAVGTVVDCGRFFNILGSTVPREASDGQCWQAHRSGDEIRIVKGADPRMVEILRLTDEDVRLAYDATDSRYPRAWRLDVLGDGRSDAFWCPAIGIVWERHTFAGARLVRRVDGGPSTSEPFPYVAGVNAHGRHIDYGGDVGVVDAVLVTRYEPHAGKTADGYHELHHWAIVNGRAIGLVRYEEVRNGAVVRSFTFTRNAPSRSVPLSSLLVHPIPDPPADVPTPEPMAAPKVDIQQYARVLDGNDATIVHVRNSRSSDEVLVDLVDGSLHVTWRNASGEDYSAKRRPVTVGAAPETPQEPSEPPPPDPPVDPPPVTPSRLVGPLRLDGERTFRDDIGSVLPVLCHAGDLLSRWTRDPAGARALMADIAAAGYDGVRTWTVLHGDYWRGREVGPMHQADYWSQVLSFAAALRTSGLRWLVSQGDLMRAVPRQVDRREFMAALARSLDDELVLGVDAGNEAWQNGEADPARLREVVEAFRAVRPCAVWSLTSPAGEERDELDPYAGSVYDVHGYRGGRSWDKIRHIFSLAYEVQPQRRLGLQSEPFGFGGRVSVTDHKHELTSDVMTLACAVSLMCRQAWVWFSGPGVMSDEAERMQDMPGFRASPAVRDWLPRDLMTFTSLVHGGASQRGRRVFAVPGVDETRADHAFADDGRFVAALYGPRWREVTQERAADITQTLDLGDAGRLVQGVRR
jgi:hypothetical protein